MNAYRDLPSGAKGMLLETAAILNGLGVKYIVVGGWSPYLFNAQPIAHPGTQDVDILFDKGYDKNSLEHIIRELLKHDFILSAKHNFQLFKVMEIAGKKFIYNLDLLHPLETQIPDEIYVEHIDLGVPASHYYDTTFKIKSIALPSSQVLFRMGLFDQYHLEQPTASGDVKRETIPLMSELGTLITKSQSVLVPKRYRDALDIYLAIRQNRDYKSMIDQIQELQSKYRSSYNTLYGIRQAFEERVFHANLHRFGVRQSIAQINEFFHGFFKDSGLDQLASDGEDELEEEIGKDLGERKE